MHYDVKLGAAVRRSREAFALCWWVFTRAIMAGRKPNIASHPCYPSALGQAPGGIVADQTIPINLKTLPKQPLTPLV
jgi:hypothetical protein